MLDKLISFIIPCHNAEKTLRRAVESITTQFDQSLVEIILVENTSTDATYTLAKDLEKEHPNTRVFQSEKGVSSARNKGLSEAVGAYVSFVDADDYLLSDVASSLVSFLQDNQADIVLLPYRKNNHIVGLPGQDQKNLVETMLKNPTLYMTVWSKVYNRKLLKEEEITFDPSLERSEDSVFLLKLLSQTQELAQLNHPYYHYSTDNVSTVRQNYKPLVSDYTLALEKAEPYFQSLDRQGFGKGNAGFILSTLTIILVRDVFSHLNMKSLSSKYGEMKQLLASPPFNTALASLSLADCLSLYYLPYLFQKLHLKSMSALIYLAKATFNQWREH